MDSSSGYPAQFRNRFKLSRRRPWTPVPNWKPPSCNTESGSFQSFISRAADRWRRCAATSPVAFSISSLCAPPTSITEAVRIGNLETANLPPRINWKLAPMFRSFIELPANSSPPYYFTLYFRSKIIMLDRSALLACFEVTIQSKVEFELGSNVCGMFSISSIKIKIYFPLFLVF